MPDRGTLAIDELLNALEGAGFSVVSVGSRYRVTNPKGGKPAFIPGRLPKGANLELIKNGLLAIGFDVNAVAQAREADRQARLKVDRDKADRLTREANERDRPSPADVRAAVEQAAAVKAEALLTRAADLINTSPFDLPAPDSPAPVVPLDARTETIHMTPGFARELLAANRFYDEAATHAGRCNRKFKPYLAERYANEMLAGNWVLIHAGIALDTNAELLDGQHRLAALVMAGEVNPDITVPLSVTYDLAPEVSNKIDTGKPKTIADILSMNGIIDVNHMGALCRLAGFYLEASRFLKPDAETVPAFHPNGYKGFKLEADEVLKMVDDDPTLRDRVTDGRALHKVVGVTPASFVYWVLIREGWSQALVDEFMLAVRDGAGLATNDPRYAVRETLLNRRARRGVNRDSIETAALILKAWKLWQRGGTFNGRGFAWRKDEEFPRSPVPEV